MGYIRHALKHTSKTCSSIKSSKCTALLHYASKHIAFFISKAAMTLHYDYIELLLLDTALTIQYDGGGQSFHCKHKILSRIIWQKMGGFK